MAVFTKKELADIYAEKNEIGKGEALELLDTVFNSLTEIVTEYGSGFKLGELGTFKTDVKPERVYKNPQTGEELPPTPAHYAVKFTPSKKAKDALKRLEV